MHFIEPASLIVDVVIGMIALDLVAIEKVLEPHVAPRFGFACFGVVIDCIRPKNHLCGFELDAAAQVGHRTFSILSIRVDIHDVRRGPIGSLTADLLVGIYNVPTWGLFMITLVLMQIKFLTCF